MNQMADPQEKNTLEKGDNDETANNSEKEAEREGPLPEDRRPRCRKARKQNQPSEQT